MQQIPGEAKGTSILQSLYDDDGLNIIPIIANSKRAAVSWGKYQSEYYPRGRLINWRGNFGVICGKVSGGLVVVDIEDPSIYTTYFKDIKTLTVKTPGGGYHLYFRTAETTRKESKFLGYPIDIQGEGSYALIPASKVDGGVYSVVGDDPILNVGNLIAYLKESLPIVRRTADIQGFKCMIDINAIAKRYTKPNHQGKGYWQGICPFHGDTKPSFTVYRDHFHCYGCGANGDVISLVEKVERIGFLEAVGKLEELTGVKYRRGGKKQQGEDEEEARITPDIVADYLMDTYYFRTLEDTEEVLLYSNGVYRKGGDAVVKAVSESYMEGEGKKNACSTHFVNEIIGHIQRSTFVKRDRFDTDANIINVQNGLLHIKEGLKPHTPEHLCLTQIPVIYDPGVRCPNVERFLDEVFGMDDARIGLEWAGYCLYRDHHIHKALMLVGDGANGKSSFLNLLRALLGKQNVSNHSLQTLEENRFAAADLAGKSANICPDIPSAYLTNTGMFKALTGGDSISVEQKFKNPFTLESYAKLAFSANQIPPTGDESAAFYRRWIILSFPNTFEGGNADKKVLEKLTTADELSGLLNLALDALRGLLEKGDFTHSKSTLEIKDEYIRKSDPIKAFVQDKLEFAAEYHIAKEALYNEYVKYCKVNGSPVKDKTVFGRKLPLHIPVISKQVTEGGGRRHAWGGVKFTDDDGLPHI